MKIDTFDHTSTTEKDPYRKRAPDLPAEATARERELAKKYTRVSFCLVPLSPDDEGEFDYEPDASHAWMVVGSQYFCLTGNAVCENREEAAWHCWMVAKALNKVLEQEVLQPPAGGEG